MKRVSAYLFWVLSLAFLLGLPPAVFAESPLPEATLHIRKPASGNFPGNFFVAPAAILIEAVATDPDGDIRRVEFFANSDLIGVSEHLTRDAVIPGRPREHHFEWRGVKPGNYELTAKAIATNGQMIEAAPVHIHVLGPVREIPIVSIHATRPETTEPAPNIRIRPGEFTVRRTGGIDQTLPVFLEIGGSATPEHDYEPLPVFVSFEPGQEETNLLVIPMSDKHAEATEYVTIRLAFPLLPDFMPLYQIDPQNDSARVAIRDSSGPSGPVLEITHPEDGQTFPGDAPIEFTAIAIDFSRVAFYAGETQIGVSEIMFFRAPDPGTPIQHSFTWRKPDPGTHAITARAVDSQGQSVISRPIVIHVGGDGPAPGATLEITLPLEGTMFPPGTPIHIEAVAVDPLGYIPSVQFHAGDMLIGTSVINFIVPPPPGTPIEHSIVWENPPAGVHRLVAQAVDPTDNGIHSKPVEIRVGGPFEQAVVSIRARRGTTSEFPPEANIVGIIISRDAGPLDIPVHVALQITGSAQNGADYVQLPDSVEIPAGARAAELVVIPLPDGESERDETVTISLLPVGCLVPSPACYLIGDPASATVIIQDGLGTGNHPPAVHFLRPPDGAVFHLGAEIPIAIEAADPDVSIASIKLFQGNTLLASGAADHLQTLWTPSAPGEYTLTARAADDAGAEASARVRLLVTRDGPDAFVHRELPGTYSPGQDLTVRLIASPPDTATAWAVEDQPPAGWTVSRITNEGVFDPSTGKVKFGPFTDSVRRTLVYVLTPPADASGPREFGGSSSIDGIAYPIAGDRIIRGANEHHPADENTDKRIVLLEVTAYAAAWKKGGDSTTIPISFVTRAAFLWKHGETYTYDPSQGAPPLCWIPALPIPELAALAAEPAGCVRTTPGGAIPGESFTIQIEAEPPPGTSGFAVEETVPFGWTVADVSGGGQFDPAAGIIRWGLFLDDEPRTLSYTLIPPDSRASVAAFEGRISFDGAVQPTAGQGRAVASTESTQIRFDRISPEPGGGVNLKISGAPGQVCVLEASSDLVHWKEIATAFLPDGTLEFADDAAGAQSNRYYRLRVK